jgi:hypothetical protein
VSGVLTYCIFLNSGIKAQWTFPSSRLDKRESIVLFPPDDSHVTEMCCATDYVYFIEINLCDDFAANHL